MGPPTHQVIMSQPINVAGSYTNMPIPPFQYYQQPGQVKLGGTAQVVMMNQSDAINNAVRLKHQEVEDNLNEIKTDQKRFAKIDSVRAVAPTAHLKRFEDALKYLQDMLAGKTQLSIADAYFAVEAAYGNLYMSREEYYRTIRASAAFIKAWILENELDTKDNNMVHYAIRKFMSESLMLHNTKKVAENGLKLEYIHHNPFRYDFNDYTGEKDYRNLFLTKCLATGYGQ